MDSISTGWRRLWPPFIANLVYSFHYAAILYVNSSFLAAFYSWQEIALLYALGSLVSMGLFFLTPRFLKRFGNRSLFTSMLLLEAAATAGLALSHTAVPAAAWFLLYGAVSSIVYYSLDIALESVTLNQRTGEVRGAYLTLADVSIAAAPLVVAARAADGVLTPIYAAAAFIILPLFLIAPFFPKEASIADATAADAPVAPFSAWWRFSDVRRVTISRGFLEFFYAIMTIFVPVYLHLTLSFSWQEIGVMFSIMLLAFVLFEWAVGELADRFWGEKEMMTAGFFIMGTSVLVMPFLGASFALWTALLFLSRLGATLTEMTCESYFWKHVSAEDVGYITIYRSVRPAAMILAALVGGIALYLAPFYALFFVLACFMFLGIRESALLVDTR